MESLRDIFPSLLRLAEPRPGRGDLLPSPVAAALAWELAAGAELAERAIFRGWHTDVLLLQTADPGTRAQIESITPELLRSLNRLLPAGKRGAACRRIQFLP